MGKSTEGGVGEEDFTREKNDRELEKVLKERFGSIEDPEERMRIMLSARFREGDFMRDRLIHFFRQVEKRYSPEQLRIKALIEGQYDLARSILDKYNLRGNRYDISPPTLEVVTDRFLGTLSFGEISFVLTKMKRPVFQIEPLLAFSRFLNTPNKEKILGVSNFDRESQRHFGKRNEHLRGFAVRMIIGWRIAIDEGMYQMEEISEQREADPIMQLKKWRLKQPKEVTLLNHRRYALLAMRMVEEGQTFDQGYYCMLDGEEAGLVMIKGRWFEKFRVIKYVDGKIETNYRFRPSIVRSIPLRFCAQPLAFPPPTS